MLRQQLQQAAHGSGGAGGSGGGGGSSGGGGGGGGGGGRGEDRCVTGESRRFPELPALPPLVSIEYILYDYRIAGTFRWVKFSL